MTENTFNHSLYHSKDPQTMLSAW